MPGMGDERSEIRLPGGGCCTVEPDQGWTDLFLRREGWTGSDGIYAAPLSGDESPGAADRTSTVFVFGDTFLGGMDPSGARVNAIMVNNTLAILEGGEPDPARIRFLWQPTPAGKPGSAVLPRTPRGQAVGGAYLWLQDVVVIGSRLHCFPLIVGPNPQGPEGFQFALHGVAHLSLPVGPDGPDWSGQTQADTPLWYTVPDGRQVSFGAALFPNTPEAGAPAPDGHLYVYGLLQGRPWPQPVVARVPAASCDDGEAWRFWDGRNWQPQREAVAPVGTATSPEFSVCPLVGGWWEGRHALVCQLGADVCLALGDSPVGPFGEPAPLYRCPEAGTGAGVYVYNAKAHPHLSRPGELLVSYNVNTTSWTEHLRQADIYRPRFVRVRAAERG